MTVKLNRLAKRMLLLIAAAIFTTGGYSMTVTGNYVVYSCPRCGAKASEMELGSWNTFGAVFWSDCFRIAPMAPSQYVVARCWKCHKAFARWSAKATHVEDGKLGPEEKGHYIEWIGDYAALKEVLDASGSKLSADDRGELLLQIVWAANNKDRIEMANDEHVRRICKGLKVETVPEDELRKALLELSAMTNLPLVLRAEIRREMKDFTGAQKCLEEFKSNPDGEWMRYAADVEQRIKAKDWKVFKR